MHSVSADDVFRVLQTVLDVLDKQQEILSQHVLKQFSFLQQRKRVAIALDSDNSERLTPETSSLPRLLKTVRGAAYREQHGLEEGDLSFFFYAVLLAEQENGSSGEGSGSEW